MVGESPLCYEIQALYASKRVGLDRD